MGSGTNGSFYALGIGLGFTTFKLAWMREVAITGFLCPRYRAGLCDGCAVEVPVTWIFAHGCANRQPEEPADFPILAFPRRQVPDQQVLARQPRLKAAI
jgi:hypothetical protein